MADIKLREVDPATIKTLDRAAAAANRIKNVTIRTKAEPGQRGEGSNSAVNYTERIAGDYSAAVYLAAKKAAVDTVSKHRENDKLLKKEQELIFGSQIISDNIISSDIERIDLSDQMLQQGAGYERNDLVKVKRFTRTYGKESIPPSEKRGQVIRNIKRIRDAPADEATPEKVRYRRAADIKAAGINSFRQKHTGFMQAGSSENSISAGSRMKELAIKQIRDKQNSRISVGIFSMPLSGSPGRVGKAPGATGLLKRLTGAMRSNISSLSITGVVTVMIIVITIMFTATFSITGNEDGNDFAYDFYGFGTGDNAIVEVARAQIGNVGGDKFWRWYGFTSHVHWCACFVSWCADQCGYTRAGIIPSYAVCDDGANWFKSHHRWANRGYTPKSGDIVFYDYDSDGHMDHTGIVEACDGRTITTIEGNVSNVCRRQTHPVGSGMIAGFGVPVYRPAAGFENACVWAAQIAGDNSFHYVNWRSGDSMTHECPVCHSHPAGNYRGWNCIGFAFACWKHGAGIRCRCSCSVVNDPNWERLLHCSSDAEANRLASRLVGVPCTVIRNGGNAIPASLLRKGDILALFNGSTYFHTIFYEGNGKYADCTSGRSDNVRANNTMSDSTKGKIKVAIRYIG